MATQTNEPRVALRIVLLATFALLLLMLAWLNNYMPATPFGGEHTSNETSTATNGAADSPNRDPSPQEERGADGDAAPQPRPPDSAGAAPPEPHAWNVIVQDTQGQPISEALVRLAANDSSSPLLESTTDEQGTVRLDHVEAESAADALLRVRAEGYEEHRETVPLDLPTTAQPHLVTLARADTDEPTDNDDVVEVRIILERVGSQEPWPDQMWLSYHNATGAGFGNLPISPEGVATFKARPGRNSVTLAMWLDPEVLGKVFSMDVNLEGPDELEFDVPHGESEVEYRIPNELGRTTIRLTDATGAPVPGVSLGQFLPPTMRSTIMYGHYATTDERGEAEAVYVVQHHTSRPWWYLELRDRPAETSTYRVPVPTPGRVEIRLPDEDASAAGPAELHLEVRDIHTNQPLTEPSHKVVVERLEPGWQSFHRIPLVEGTIHLPNLPLGRYAITLLPKGQPLFVPFATKAWKTPDKVVTLQTGQQEHIIYIDTNQNEAE